MLLPQLIPNMPSEYQKGERDNSSIHPEAQDFADFLTRLITSTRDEGQETTSSMKPEEQNFLDAMVKLYKDEESTDAYLVCQGIRKPVHKAVLVAR